jgi:hypothetical protein
LHAKLAPTNLKIVVAAPGVLDVYISRLTRCAVNCEALSRIDWMSISAKNSFVCNLTVCFAEVLGGYFDSLDTFNFFGFTLLSAAGQTANAGCR